MHKEKANEKNAATKRATNQFYRQCSKVDLEPKSLSRSHWLKHSLGAFTKVLSRSDCPLCRLAIAFIIASRRGLHGFDDEGFSSISPLEEVELWGGAGKRILGRPSHAKMLDHGYPK